MHSMGQLFHVIICNTAHVPCELLGSRYAISSIVCVSVCVPSSQATADLKSLPMLDDGLVSGKLRHTPHPDLPASLKVMRYSTADAQYCRCTFLQYHPASMFSVHRACLHVCIVCVSLALQAVLARALSTSPDDRPTLADIMTTLEQSVPDLLAAQQQKAMQRHIEALRKQQQQQQRQQMMLQQMMQQDMAVYGP